MGTKSSRPSREVSKRLSKINTLYDTLYEGQVFCVGDEEYLNGYEINPIDYICIDRELREEYENEFGLDTKDAGYSYYTHEEQIERYAKNMIFWIKHRPNIDYDEIDSDVQALLFYVSSQMLRLQHKILELTPALQKAIHGRVKELLYNK